MKINKHQQICYYARKLGVYFLSILIFNIHTSGQDNQNDTLSLNGTIPNGQIRINTSLRLYHDSTNKISFESILQGARFIAFSEEEIKALDKDSNWLRLTIKNTNRYDSLIAIISLGEHKLVEIHEKGNNQVINHKLDWDTWGPTTTSKTRFEIPIKIPPLEYRTYWIKTTEFIFFSRFDPILFSEKTYAHFIAKPSFINAKLFAFLCMIIGVCFFMGIFALVQCIYTQDLTYGFWFLYLWANTIFFFAEFDRIFALKIIKFVKENGAPLPWTIPAQYWVQITYILFLNSFLEIKKYKPAIFQFIKGSIVAMAAGLLFALFAVSNYNLRLTDYADMVILFTNILILILFFKIIKANIPQNKLLMIGTFGVLMTATFSAIAEIFELKNTGIFWLIPIVCYGVGAIFELTFFSLALSQRTRLIQLENQQLQKNYTKQLETDLAERVEIIQTQNKQLEEQRIISLTSEFEQKIAETEITALRSQMNPHFIFNCLNSIKLYSLENDSQAASDYLTKFSRLIRLVLENSRSEKVTLENELETLHLYIQMEAMRFKDKVKFKINVSPEIDQQFIEIPPLLLQPFVENAIWHGLMHKEEGGMIKVNIKLPQEHLLHIEIIDNGVGREKSAEYKSKSATRNKSFGMKVTSERIELINQIYKTNTKVEIIDLKDTKGEASGTKVILNIPI